MDETKQAIIDRVRVRLADETSLKEELLEELTQTAIDRINLKVGDVVFNPLLIPSLLMLLSKCIVVCILKELTRKKQTQYQLNLLKTFWQNMARS